MITAANFHGSTGLTTYLRALEMGPGELKRYVDAAIPRELGHYVLNKDESGYDLKPVRELITMEGIEGTDLIQTEFFATIKEGAEPRQAMRNFIPTINLGSGSGLKIPKSTSGSYAEEVAETTEVPPTNAKYSAVDVTIKKIGTRPQISDEMMADSNYDLIALEIRRAGAKIENKFNRDSLLACLSATNIQEHDCNGSNLGLSALAKARSKVNKVNRSATKMLITPDMEYQVLSSLLPVSTSVGYEQVMRTGQVGRILGLDAYETTVSTGNNSYVWEYDSDGDFGAIVADVDEFALNVIRQDITVKRYDDPVKQIQGGVITMRYGTGIVDATAACRIKY